jgi:hypothetical protein
MGEILEIIPINPDELEKIGIKKIEKRPIEAKGQYHYSGQVKPGSEWSLFGDFAWRERDPVDIWGSWSPIDQVLEVGIVDLGTGKGFAYRIKDGRFSVSFSVPWNSGKWNIGLRNPAPPNTLIINYDVYARVPPGS